MASSSHTAGDARSAYGSHSYGADSMATCGSGLGPRGPQSHTLGNAAVRGGSFSATGVGSADNAMRMEGGKRPPSLHGHHVGSATSIVSPPHLGPSGLSALGPTFEVSAKGVGSAAQSLNARVATPQPGENPDTQDLTVFIHNMLQEMQDRFQTISDTIVNRLDDMSGRIDELEESLSQLMVEAGAEQGGGGGELHPSVVPSEEWKRQWG